MAEPSSLTIRCAPILDAIRPRGIRVQLGEGGEGAEHLDARNSHSGPMRAETRYAKNGDVHIAYQVLGEGPLDLVLVHGWVQSFDARTEIEPIERFYRRLASFSRLILFDKRGTGLSDRVPLDDLPTLETRMDDMRAVMDEVGVERAAVLGHSEGGAMCALFAATYPDRAQALVMSGASARTRWAPDYPLGATDDALEELQRLILDNWGYEGVRSLLETMAPSIVDDEELVHAHTRAALRAASPAAAAALTQMSAMIDVRHVLPAIRVPTLVLYRADEMLAEASRYVGERIPGAKIVELPGNEHMPWLGDQDAALDEIEEFLTGFRPHPVLDRVLATVLFTDIVGSTELAADLGDRRWRELLEQHNDLVRRELARFRGHELSTAGDGFLATFDGPGRAVACAVSIRDAATGLGLQIRFGLHTGELELAGSDVRGIAVHTGARVAGLAGPNEVLASSTVRDLVAGSGLEFEDRGSHQLKGVPGEWRLYAVAGP
jgi:pimeloyl-ACP methyl ester carboxylesterase